MATANAVVSMQSSIRTGMTGDGNLKYRKEERKREIYAYVH